MFLLQELFADSEYSITEFPGILKTTSSGSLANISHLLLVSDDSKKNDSHPLVSWLLELIKTPLTVKVSPVCKNCWSKVSSPIVIMGGVRVDFILCISALGMAKSIP